MKIKTFIVILATVSGLIVSLFTAVMTFVIIGEPICSTMILKIALTILFVLPVIGLLSFFAGTYLSKKFSYIQCRLDRIKEQTFRQNDSKHYISEIREINNDINFLSNQLKHLFNDLKQKNQNLSNLLISMAHDVKTPITILNGYIEEIEDGLIKNDDLPSALIHMKKEIAFLDELTVDMLEFISSMEKHKIKEKINLYNLLEKDIITILPKLGNLKLINDIPKDFCVEFNKVDLKKICINLLLNALRYTKEGYIKVYVKNNAILFENSGEEIKSEYKDKIFEPFFTVSKSKNRKNSGFGLGLSIVNNLSKNNDYKCILYSSTKEKTIFSLKEEE